MIEDTSIMIEIQEDISCNLFKLMNATENSGYFDKKSEAYQSLDDREKRAVDILDEGDMFCVLSAYLRWVNLVWILHYGKFMNIERMGDLYLVDIDGEPYCIKEVIRSSKSGKSTVTCTLLLQYDDPLFYLVHSRLDPVTDDQVLDSYAHARVIDGPLGKEKHYYCPASWEKEDE